jgi:DNA topoisomerase I
VHLQGSTLELDFPAKGSVRQRRSLRDPDLVSALRPLVDRPGDHELLSWLDQTSWRDITSRDINAYVRDVTGGDFSAKDFRTWHAGCHAIAEFSRRDVPGSERAVARQVREVMTLVAEHLGNTPAVARRSYVDPRLVDLYRDGELAGIVESHRSAERAVLAALRPGATRSTKQAA